mmetsp:Transcript_18914/g.28609  ORF Transcript_18914/g.28609 Transcript_18914/m.28609 type:complete len:84 (+) Transcript_18914:137-388(+)
MIVAQRVRTHQFSLPYGVSYYYTTTTLLVRVATYYTPPPELHFCWATFLPNLLIVKEAAHHLFDCGQGVYDQGQEKKEEGCCS